MAQSTWNSTRQMFSVSAQRSGWWTHLLSDNSNFLRLGSLGKLLSDVTPTFIKLSFSNAVNSSVKPSMLVLRQLSKLSSLICGRKASPLKLFPCANRISNQMTVDALRREELVKLGVGNCVGHSEYTARARVGTQCSPVVALFESEPKYRRAFYTNRLVASLLFIQHKVSFARLPRSIFASPPMTILNKWMTIFSLLVWKKNGRNLKRNWAPLRARNRSKVHRIDGARDKQWFATTTGVRGVS